MTVTITLSEYFWMVFVTGFSMASCIASIMWLNFKSDDK